MQLFASELQAKHKEERENLERGEAFALLHIDKDVSWAIIKKFLRIILKGFWNLYSNVNWKAVKNLLFRKKRK